MSRHTLTELLNDVTVTPAGCIQYKVPVTRPYVGGFEIGDNFAHFPKFQL